MTEEELQASLAAQRDRFIAGFRSARALGHVVSKAGRDGEYTLHTACEVCGLAYAEPLAIGGYVPALPMTYCPRRPWEEHTAPGTGDRKWFWFWPHQHRTDVADCLCDRCSGRGWHVDEGD